MLRAMLPSTPPACWQPDAAALLHAPLIAVALLLEKKEVAVPPAPLADAPPLGAPLAPPVDEAPAMLGVEPRRLRRRSRNLRCSSSFLRRFAALRSFSASTTSRSAASRASRSASSRRLASSSSAATAAAAAAAAAASAAAAAFAAIRSGRPVRHFHGLLAGLPGLPGLDAPPTRSECSCRCPSGDAGGESNPQIPTGGGEDSETEAGLKERGLQFGALYTAYGLGGRW